MRDVVVFVHPWMWAVSMFADVRARGLGIVSIVTGAEGTRIDPVWLAAHSDYVLHRQGNVEEVSDISTVLQAEGLKPVAVINGLDSTLVFADAIQAHLLGLDLDLEASAVRLNKYAVNETLRRAGVPSVPTVRIRSEGDAATRVEAIAALGTPFIAKPAGDTAGMAGVELLADHGALVDYLRRRLGHANGYYPDQTVQEVVVQKYMASSRYREFTVDFLSVDGVHECVGISENQKDDQGVFRATVTFDTTASPGFAVVTAYVRRCLDALKVRWGFSHNEVFWDMAEEVFLVETNNRYAGQPVTDLYALSYERSPLAPLIERKPVTDAGRVSQRARHGAAVYLYNISTESPDALDLGEATPYARITDFRGKGRPAIARDFASAYDRGRHIGAIVIIESDHAGEIERLTTDLVARDREGRVFVAAVTA
ncbi:MAG TPA: hypothetical protein VGN46_14120 [Luteibacter sp.]|jgi:hypothetical protein|uniref:ATP-grasp domain-containing protein n=1 Tax=Luteibacter sp. TaxID=1886636 RepID=UPI002F3FB607